MSEYFITQGNHATITKLKLYGNHCMHEVMNLAKHSWELLSCCWQWKGLTSPSLQFTGWHQKPSCLIMYALYNPCAPLNWQHNTTLQCSVCFVNCRTVTVHCSVFENQLSAIQRSGHLQFIHQFSPLLEALGLEKQQLIIDIRWNK